MSALQRRTRRLAITRGLTLLELMITLAMLAVLLGAAMPSMSAMLSRNRLRSAAEHLAMDLGEARQEAARLGQPVHIGYQTGPHWCYSLSTEPVADCRLANDKLLKVVSHQDHPGVVLVQAAAQRFDPVSGASLTEVAPVLLASPQGEQLRVRVSRLGRPGVCAPDVPVAAIRPC
jgi:type IV fimbrial biogenesis protein FimT